MIRYGKHSKLSPAEVLAKAVAFFGPGGVGLNVTEQDECHISFEGGGGFVTISVCPKESGTEIELASREWDHQATEFIAKV